MITYFTVENALQAKQQVDNLTSQGYTRNNIYIFAHNDQRMDDISKALQTEEVGMEERGVMDTIENLFVSQGDELRNDMKAVGLSQIEAEEAESQLDLGKLVVVANNTK